MNENEFEIPAGYGETGVPSFDQTSHYVPEPFNAQAPYAVQLDYAAPGFDQTSHFVQPPYNAQPPYAVEQEYGVPGFAQTSHGVCPPYNAQPPYSVQVGYGDAPFSAAGAHPQVGLPYSTSEGTFTFRSDGTVDAVVNGQSVTYLAGSRKARKAVEAALISVGEGKPKTGAGAVFDQIGDVLDVFIPSGIDTKTPASNTGGSQPFPWGTVAWVAGGLAVLGIGGYFLLRKKDE
jgi:hypothetical protein